MALKQNRSHIADSKGSPAVIASQQAIAGYVVDTEDACYTQQTSLINCGVDVSLARRWLLTEVVHSIPPIDNFVAHFDSCQEFMLPYRADTKTLIPEL